jgi:hypothetical protein
MSQKRSFVRTRDQSVIATKHTWTQAASRPARVAHQSLETRLRPDSVRGRAAQATDAQRERKTASAIGFPCRQKPIVSSRPFMTGRAGKVALVTGRRVESEPRSQLSLGDKQANVVVNYVAPAEPGQAVADQIPDGLPSWQTFVPPLPAA